MKFSRLTIGLLALIPFLTSCDKDEDNNELTFDKSKSEIVLGKTDKVTIQSGDGTYTVTSSDPTIVTVKEASKVITLTAVKIGTATVTVKDKSGKTGSFAVAVIKDPYETMKADAKTRFVWDTSNKVKGTNAGTYKLTQATDGKVEFSWKSEDAKNSIVLGFTSAVGSIAEGVKTAPKLTIDGKSITVSSLEVVQNKIVNTGEKATIWIAFKAETKSGVCVATLE